jgi:formyl-CoA transferase
MGAQLAADVRHCAARFPARYLMKGEVPQRSGNDHPTSMPTSAYATADGHINIGAYGQPFWMRLCETLERADLLQDPRFSTDPLRVRHRAELNTELARSFSQNSSAHWISLLNLNGVPCGPIYAMDQVFADPQVQHLGAAQTLQHPQLGPIQVINQAATLTRTPAQLLSATPALGEQSGEVLMQAGYSAAEIEQFRREGVI